MDKPEVCFVAQFPPPIHGLSKAVDTLYNSRSNKAFRFKKIDISKNRNILKTVFKLITSQSDIYYLTISQSKFGNLRDLFLLRLIAMKNAKCVVHLHGGYYRQLVEHDLGSWQRKLNYRAMKNVDGAIVLGKSLRYNFEGMVDDSRIFEVKNCVDDEYLMNDRDFDKKLHVIPTMEPQHVLYLSNMIKAKGYLDVLKLAVSSRTSGEFHFDFAGKFFSEAEKQEFSDIVQKEGLQDLVTYHGVVTGAAKRRLLNKGKFFILPTKYPKEGQPISILEAMGNGMVIISTNHAGIPDLVKDGVNGILIDQSWSAALLFDWMRGVDYYKMVKKSRLQVLNDYTETRYVKEMLSVFKSVLGSAGAKSE